MSAELLPCPFCGAEAYIRKRYQAMPRDPGYQVQCGECYCGTSDRYEKAEYAALTWNKRAALRARESEPEEVRADLKLMTRCDEPGREAHESEMTDAEDIIWRGGYQAGREAAEREASDAILQILEKHKRQIQASPGVGAKERA